MQNLELLKLIIEPKVEDKANPARRWSVPFPRNFVAGLLSEAYIREVRSRGYEPQESESVMQKIHAVSRWLTDASTKPFLLLYGENPGTGKTTLAKAIYRVISEEIPAMKKRLEYAIFVDGGLRDSIRNKANERIKDILPPELRELFFSNPHDGWGKLSDGYPEIYNRAVIINRKCGNAIDAIFRKLDSVPCLDDRQLVFASSHQLVIDAEQGGRDSLWRYNAKFLILDDVGAEADSVNHMGNRILPITEVLLERYDHRKITIITSNLSDDGLADMYGARVADRLNEVADKIAFMGNSFRK